MRKKRFLAGLGLTAALAAGGIGAAWLAAPVISGAQTTDTTTPPATTAPGNGQAPAQTPGNCPHMGQNGGGTTGSGGSGGTSSEATNLSWRGGGGFNRL
jgi:hypothetical protein